MEGTTHDSTVVVTSAGVTTGRATRVESPLNAGLIVTISSSFPQKKAIRTLTYRMLEKAVNEYKARQPYRIVDLAFQRAS